MNSNISAKKGCVCNQIEIHNVEVSYAIGKHPFDDKCVNSVSIIHQLNLAL